MAAVLLRKHGVELKSVRKSVKENGPEPATGGRIGTGSSNFSAQRTGRIGLVESSPTEFLLSYHEGAYLPHVGEKITIQEEGTEARLYRIEDITWEFERGEDFSELKNVRFKVARLDG